jgi:hypothetical protein
MADLKTETKIAASAPAVEMEGSYVDWSAIIAGAIVAAAIGALFTAFGAGLGLSTISPFQNEGFGMWGVVIFGIWMLVTMIVSYMAGGYFAGRMRRRMDFAEADEVQARDGLHGAVVWAVAALIGLIVIASTLTTAARLTGDAISATADAVTATASGVTEMVGDAEGISQYLPEGMQSDPLEYINSTLLRGTELSVPTLSQDAADPVEPETKQVLIEIVRTGEVNEDDRAYLQSVVADRTSLTQSEVDARVDAAIARAQELRAEAVEFAEEAEQTAREAADYARVSAVISAFTIAAGLLISAAAAMFGATIGGRHRDEGHIFGGFTYHTP